MSLIIPGKFIYLANPMVASRATESAFPEGIKGTFHHSKLTEFNYNGEDIVIGVRNHFDVFASLWVQNRKAKPLDEFIRTYRTNFMIDGLFDYHFADILAQVGAKLFVWRYEELETCVAAAQERYGLRPLEMRTIGVTKGKNKNYRNYYYPKAVTAMHKRFEQEMRLYGYGF